MITLNPIPNVHRFDRHIIAIETDSGEIGHRLHNPFALDERKLDADEAAHQYRFWLWEQMQAKQTAYRDMVRIAKAINRGAWVQISYASEYTHGEQLSKALAYLAEALPTEQPQPCAMWAGSGPCLEPLIDYHVDTEFAHFSEPVAEMYQPVVEQRLKPEECDINPYQIAWLCGRNAARLVMLVDDFVALVPDYGFISTKPFTVRYAKHSIGRSPHVQAALAEAYNQFYKVDPCNWSYDPEYLESEYDPELSSRYYTDIDPHNEKNYEHDHAVDWVAVAAADDYVGGIVGQQARFSHFTEMLLEQEDEQPIEKKLDQLANDFTTIYHMQEAYSHKGESSPLMRKGIKSQSRGQRFKEFATKMHAEEYRRKFRKAA